MVCDLGMGIDHRRDTILEMRTKVRGSDRIIFPALNLNLSRRPAILAPSTQFTMWLRPHLRANSDHSRMGRDAQECANGLPKGGACDAW